MHFREFKRFAGRTLEDVVSWLMNELNSIMRETSIGLNNLKFQDNFETYQLELSLSATEERQVSHPFREIPSGYIIFKQVGDGVVDAGITPWTSQVAYIRNNSATNSVQVTVIFFA